MLLPFLGEYRNVKRSNKQKGHGDPSVPKRIVNKMHFFRGLWGGVVIVGGFVVVVYHISTHIIFI
jgi:hypothetical protein